MQKPARMQQPWHEAHAALCLHLPRQPPAMLAQVLTEHGGDADAAAAHVLSFPDTAAALDTFTQQADDHASVSYTHLTLPTTPYV